MFLKFANAKMDLLNAEQAQGFLKQASIVKTALTKEILLDPNRYIYAGNRAVSSMEWWAANDNGDGFPDIELTTHGNTFVGARSSFDHSDDRIGGMVFDSTYTGPIYTNKKFAGGAFIRNVLVLDKKKLESLSRMFYGGIDLVAAIMNGEINDTSMGAIVQYTECSVPTCRHYAKTEAEYCEHIAGGKNRSIKIASGETCDVFEICHDVTFFEDSVIVPSHLGGIAGGRGADSRAEILEIYASKEEDFPLGKYIVDRRAQVKKGDTGILNTTSGPAAQGSDPAAGVSGAEPPEMGEEPEDIEEEKKHQLIRKHMEDQEPGSVVHSVRKPLITAGPEDVGDAALNYLTELLKQGKKYEEALEEVKKVFGSSNYDEYRVVELSGGRSLVCKVG